MRRKQAAVPARKRNIQIPFRRRWASRNARNGPGPVNYSRGIWPVSLCRAAAIPRANPLDGSRTLTTASALKTVNGRSLRDDVRETRNSRASSINFVRECGSLQCCAPSISDQSWPAASASSEVPPSKRAPIPNSKRPRSFRPSACASSHGNGSSNGSQPSSSRDSSPPLTPRGSSSRATAWRVGSAGALPAL